ncbi:mechanosensitive ion channel family protein [soil metagenome]
MIPALAAIEGVANTVSEVCGDEPNVFCRVVLEATNVGGLAAIAGAVLPLIFRVLVIVVLAMLIARLARRVIRRLVANTANDSRDAIHALRRRASTERDPTTELTRAARERVTQRSNTIAGVIGSVAAFAVWTFAIASILSSLGLDIGPLIAGAGIVGVALGFGAQSLVKDFLSGIFMLLEDQYGIGDIINVGDATGTVEHVSLRVTRIRDVEGTVWHIPNGEILRVGNMSQLWSRSLLDIGVAYDTDLDHASRVIQDIADRLSKDPEWDEAILEPPELWGVQQFGPNEVVLRLVIKVKPAVQWKVNREFRRRLKDAFDREGIEIPFPQRTVWLKQEGQPPAGVPAAALPQDPSSS